MLTTGCTLFLGQFDLPQGDRRKDKTRGSQIVYTFSDFIDTITKSVN